LIEAKSKCGQDQQDGSESDESRFVMERLDHMAVSSLAAKPPEFIISLSRGRINN
jgi:hypothetical protein